MVGEGVDARRKRGFPGALGQPGYCSQRFGRKHLSILGCEHEHDVVILGISVLQVFECHQLRVVLPEKHAVVVSKGKMLETGPHCHDPENRQNYGLPLVTQDKLGIFFYHY